MLRNKMKKVVVGAVAVAALTTLGVGSVATTANADVEVGTNTNWTIPHEAMTNVVTIGNQDYKVITTQTASNWVTAGPDWVGVSNSAQLSTAQGASSATVATSTMTGIWASEANQVPNAYNWNYFYNLYAAEQELSTADLAIANSGTSIGQNTGVATGLKYRPEIMWTDGISATDQLYYYVQYIQEGKYWTTAPTLNPIEETTGTGRDQTTKVVGYEPGDDGVAADASSCAAPYDSDYNPYDVGMDNDSNNPYAVGELLYKMADYVEATKAATENFDGKDLNGNEVTAANATWLTMNALPRTSRYEASEENPMSARDCALAFEQVEKGSVYFILSQVNAGNVKKKKVAYITTDPEEGTNTANVAAFDAYDSFSPQSSNGNGFSNNAGFAGISPLAVDQLVPKKYEIVASDVGGGQAILGAATCDELAACDVIFITGSGSTNGTTNLSPTQLKDWVVAGATTSANKKAAESIQYACIAPTQCNAKNFSVDKSIYGIYCLDVAYPELFPNMELEAYWYNCIYHIKAQYLQQAMQWTLANTSLPDETSLDNISNSYSIADIENKATYGFEYYKNSGSSDPVISKLIDGTGLVTGAISNFTTFEASDTWTGHAADVASTQEYQDYAKSLPVKKAPTTTPKSPAKKSQTIKLAKKSLKVKKGKKGTVKVKNAKGKLAVKVTKKVKKALKVTVKGTKVTVKASKKAKKGKTYKVQVYAKATSSYAQSKAVTLKVKIK